LGWLTKWNEAWKKGEKDKRTRKEKGISAQAKTTTLTLKREKKRRGGEIEGGKMRGRNRVERTAPKEE